MLKDLKTKLNQCLERLDDNPGKTDLILDDVHLYLHIAMDDNSISLKDKTAIRQAGIEFLLMERDEDDILFVPGEFLDQDVADGDEEVDAEILDGMVRTTILRLSDYLNKEAN